MNIALCIMLGVLCVFVGIDLIYLMISYNREFKRAKQIKLEEKEMRLREMIHNTVDEYAKWQFDNMKYNIEHTMNRVYELEEKICSKKKKAK